jgi:hypothetical protein
MIEKCGVTPACRKWLVILQNSCGYLMLWISWWSCSSARKISLHIWPLLRSPEGANPLAPLQNAPLHALEQQ